MLNALKNESNMTLTENGAATLVSTGSGCLDLFATIGAIRNAEEADIIKRFVKAYAEDADAAMKILFFGRDVRGGLGERRVFRVILHWLANHEEASVRRNMAYIAEYGRWDDLLCLMGTHCEADAVALIREQLNKDLENLKEHATVSLMAKWLPSVNASNRETVRMGRKLATALGMTEAQYRRMLVTLRHQIRIIENNLREADYTFDYEKQPSKAMFKYRKAFLRHDEERYREFMGRVETGEAQLHTGTLAPYEIIAPCFSDWGAKELTEAERASIHTTWNALDDFGGNANALVVVDGSGSMYGYGTPMPEAVALSLGIYFAERNTGLFHNHFITFSEHPQLVEIKGRDIVEKVRYCTQFNEVANTDIQKVFELILNAAIRNQLSQADMPSTIYIVSDMEFDRCAHHADMTNFQYAKKLYAEHGYRLPDVVFWNVQSRNTQQPVSQNEQGVALVSGCTPRLFQMVAGGVIDPYSVMMDTINATRYERISA